MGTKHSAEALLLELDRAFPVEPKPATLPGRQSCGGDEYGYVEQFFHDLAWNEITLEDLRDRYPGPPDACLYFMSASAFCYFLPTYLTFFLQRWDEADSIADTAVYALVPTSDEKLRDWQAARFEQFNSIQRRVILDFLKFAEQNYKDNYTFFGLADALNYWESNA